MAKLLKLRRGTTTQHSSFTGAEGEVTIDTTKDTAVVHDGSQAGGRPLAREDMSNVSSIAGTKISPDFGSQNVVTTGTLGSGTITTTGDIVISSAGPKISLVDTGQNPDYDILNTDGTFQVSDTTNGAVRFRVNTDGHVDFLTNVDFGAGIDVTGITASTGGVRVNTDGSASADYISAGASQDLKIYHDGSHSYIRDTGTGGLRITTDSFNVVSSPNNESMITATENGAVNLYHDHNLKLETVTGGVTITGTASATTFSGSGASLTNLPAANLTGTLPALDGSNLTGIAGIPSGVIAMWSGAISAIPSGWNLCDGNNSTPDLRDKFIVGAGDYGHTAYPGVDPGATGGSQTGTIHISVNGNTGWASQYSNASSNPNASPEPFNSRDRHQHGWGGTFPHSYDKMPPYYALAFIMKS